MIDWIFAHLPKDWGRLPSLPSTQFKTLVGARLSYMTAIYFFSMGAANKTVDPITFGLWLGFVGTWAALSVKQFTSQRMTDYGFVERKGTAPTDPVPAAQSTTTATMAVSTKSDPG